MRTATVGRSANRHTTTVHRISRESHSSLQDQGMHACSSHPPNNLKPKEPQNQSQQGQWKRRWRKGEGKHLRPFS